MNPAIPQNKALIVTGTDTGIGKTVISAALTAALKAQYWKPIQSGLEEQTDTQCVAQLTGARVLPEVYRLQKPASPHLAAEAENIEIALNRLHLPEYTGNLIIEGAGGGMVPVNRQAFYIDIFAHWRLPIIVVARTALGTINHTALTLAALRARQCPILGVIFNGHTEPDVEQSIITLCQTRHLGRIPPLETITKDNLQTIIDSLNLPAIYSAL